MHALSSAGSFGRFIGHCFVVALVAGCGVETTVADAGSPIDVPRVDAPVADVPVADTPAVDNAPPVDVPKAQSSIIYGPCRSDDECAVGLTCRTEAATGFPSGECNHVCTTDDDCVLFPSDGSAPVDGWCPAAVGTAPRMCMRVCANGIDCERDGYTCRLFNSGMINQVHACIPVCTDDTCVNGTVCDHDTAACRPMSTTPVGRTLGQTCTPLTRGMEPPPPADMRCRSNICQPDWNPDSRGNHFYTGWNGGYCFSRCILPEGYNSSTFWGAAGSTPELPRSNCPMNGVCWPSGSYARGDVGNCYQSCMSNTDCRASDGYFCQKTVRIQTSATAFTTRRFTNGICIPVNCADMTTPCPMGLTCRRTTSSTGAVTGACIPPVTMTP